jgi:7,8-dihydropterin-6-yl-methyl-4-(beta-D-ribofuranosyl)aminobenzene 5'-phosphate synthase
VARPLSPAWWPALALASPVLAPALVIANRRFRNDCTRAARRNRLRLDSARPLELPELDWLEITPVVEWQAEEGFLGDAGVSYLIRTDRGTLLYDVGFGASHPALAHNAEKLGLRGESLDAVAISHLHPDHMGGINASKMGRVSSVPALTQPGLRPCFVPDVTLAEGYTAIWVEGPRTLAAGLGSTGPLARGIFFMGLTEEQVLLARLKGRGLVVIMGCGHPGIHLILDMAQRLSTEPIYAIAGGLHFPITQSRGARLGVQPQMILGTGKPPWRPLTDEDLDRALDALNAARPAKVFISAHDSCDYALARFEMELDTELAVLSAGATYRL